MQKYYVEVDFNNTKKVVDEFMKKYKYYLLSVSNEPLVVKDNKINVIYDENYGKFIIDKTKFQEKKEYVEWINGNINKLDPRSRQIIIHTYFGDNRDDYLAHEIGYTRCYFYTLKKEAIITLAFALNIEVTEEVAHESN